VRFGVLLALVLVIGALFAGSGGAASQRSHEDAPWSWPGAVMLSVDTTPAGDSAGNVRSDPYRIDCPGACTRPYTPGQSVTLTEAPTHGFTFAGWSGATCAEGQTSSTCTFVINADTHVVADYSGMYDPSPVGTSCCTLNVNVQGFEAGVFSGSGNDLYCYTPYFVWLIRNFWDPSFNNHCSIDVQPGAEVVLYAESWCDNFLGWSDGDQSWTKTVRVTSNQSYTAKFDGC
jgi:hypothetical protein